MAESLFSAGRLLHPLRRRSFLRVAGATASATALTLAGCGDEDGDSPVDPFVEVGAGDAGALNLALALEQLELAFYLAVRQGTYYAGLAADSAEKQVLDDIALHENLHVTALRNILTGAGAIKTLTVDFSSIDFNLRLAPAGAAKMGVLDAARAFEDLGVAAYNGAARYLNNSAYLLLAGKIVSVEARHAALIRDLIDYNTFVGSDIVDGFVPASGSSAPGVGSGSGLEQALTPPQVIAVANKFLMEGSKLTVAKLV